MYRKLQVFYHQFLTSAIAVLFLASVHAPVRFSSTCREEFYMAMELVKDLSAKSWVSKRLWRTIGALKEVAPRIGLRQNQAQEDTHSTATRAMPSLSSSRMATSTASSSPISTFGRPPVSASTPTMAPQAPTAAAPPDTASLSPNNGVRIRNEMSRMFEGYVEVGGLAMSAEGHQGYSAPPTASLQAPGSTNAPSNAFSPTETTVYQHFREMF